MNGGGDQRRLSAVLTADVVGYTRLMEVDAEGTVAAWKSARADIIDPAIADHRGRIVKHTGDGFLAEFSTVLDAVSCATAMQKQLGTGPLDFRVGVSLGDIIDDGEDIHGEGVNIAARIEALADPGGICISGDVYNQVRNRLDCMFDDLGEHDVKNVSASVRIWRIVPEGAKPDRATGPIHNPPLPDKPSIAVLPFNNMSGDPDQEYFSDGIAEDIITSLSRFHSFFVIARNSSFTYKGDSIDLRRVSRELGVQYVLEGSVRKVGDRVRITAQLVDAIADHHVWAEKYDRDLEDIFAIQDEITEHICMAAAPELQSAEMNRARHKSVPELSIWELTARASWHIGMFVAEDNALAQELLNKALEIDPESPLVLSTLAQSYTFDGMYGWQRPPAESLVNAMEMARRAIALDKQDEGAHMTLGLALLMSKRHDEAMNRLETAIRLNPNYSPAIGWLGVVHVYTHEHEQAAALLHKAIRLSPRDAFLAWYVGHFGMIEIMAERYDKAVGWLEKAALESADMPSIIRGKVVAYALQDKLEEARASFEHLNRLVPGVTIQASMNAVPFTRDDDAIRWEEGLRRAGMPE